MSTTTKRHRGRPARLAPPTGPPKSYPTYAEREAAEAVKAARRVLREAEYARGLAKYDSVRQAMLEQRLELNKIFKYQPLTHAQRRNKLVCLEREIETLTRTYKELRAEYDELERQAAQKSKPKK